MPTDPNHPAPRFRRPHPPTPIDPFELAHPSLPPSLDPLTILHISDLHVRRRPGERSTIARLLQALEQTPADLIALTGDFMHHPGHERDALAVLRDVLDACQSRLGVFGVFGNHDTPAFQRRALLLQGIHWLPNSHARPAPGLIVLGSSYPEDLASAYLDRAAPPPAEPRADERSPHPPSSAPTAHPARRGLFAPPAPAEATPAPSPEFVLALSHSPSEIVPASHLGVHLLLSGHTHAGQVRFTRRLALHTSCDLPMHLASGILRRGSTLCAISRGLGEAVFEFRLNCPRQAPLLTVRRGALPGPPNVPTTELRRVIAW